MGGRRPDTITATRPSDGYTLDVTCSGGRSSERRCANELIICVCACAVVEKVAAVKGLQKRHGVCVLVFV